MDLINLSGFGWTKKKLISSQATIVRIHNSIASECDVQTSRCVRGYLIFTINAAVNEKN